MKFKPVDPYKEIWIRWHCWLEEQRWIARQMRCWRHFPLDPSFSISAMACSRKRPSLMWSSWLRGFEAHVCDRPIVESTCGNGTECKKQVVSRDCRHRNSCGPGRRTHRVAALESLSVGESLACHSGDVLDGRNVVPPAPLCVPLWSRDRFAPVRNVQGNGTTITARDYQSRNGAELGARLVDGLRRCVDFSALVAVQAAACCRIVRNSWDVGALDQ